MTRGDDAITEFKSSITTTDSSAEQSLLSSTGYGIHYGKSLLFTNGLAYSVFVLLI